MLSAFQLGILAAAAGAAGSGTDAHFSSVVLLMHFNGADGSTTFSCSATARSITREGGPVIEDAQSLFGGTSGFFDGAGDRLLLGGSPTDFNLGATYTIEFAIYPVALPGSGNWCRLFITGINGATSTLVVQFDSSGVIGVGIASGGTTGTYTPSGTLTTGSMQRFAISVNAGACKIFKNGIEVASGTVTTQTSGFSGNPRIGFDTALTVDFNFNGYLDEFRVTNGVARYAGDYTPDAAAFPDSGPP